jgi:hypothetical protein
MALDDKYVFPRASIATKKKTKQCKCPLINLITNHQFNDRLKKIELTLLQKTIEFFFYRLGFQSKQINLIRGIFNYPKVKVMFSKYYKFYDGKYLDSNERFFLKIFIKKVFPFFKLYKKIN